MEKTVCGQWIRAALPAIAAASLVACSLPEPQALPERSDQVERAGKAMLQAAPNPVVSVPVPKGTLVAHSMRGGIPHGIASRPVAFALVQPLTLDEFATVLADQGVPVVFRWEGDGAGSAKRTVPVRRYSGTVGGLAAVLRSGAGVAVWWQDGVMMISDRDRYAVAVPQHDEVVKAVKEELGALGAKVLTTSLRGGQVVYEAPPGLQEEIVKPYLERLKRNMAMISLQLAVVSVEVNDETASGIDWSKLNFTHNSNGYTAPAASASGSGTSGSDTGTTGGTTGSSAATSLWPTTLDPSSKEFIGSLMSGGAMVLGGSFGAGAYNVAAAIDMLSEFGTLRTEQNVEVKTLSGTPLSISSGEKIPYVSGVAVNALAGGSSSGGSSGMMGSAQTSTVDTGLKVDIMPYFDADSELVTMSLKLDLTSLLKFVTLAAGSQIGNLTQPETQTQKLDDIVRVAAGSTVVVGGLQYNRVLYENNSLVAVRNVLGDDNPLNHKSQTVKRSALFLVLRPTVTLFVEADGLERRAKTAGGDSDPAAPRVDPEFRRHVDEISR